MKSTFIMSKNSEPAWLLNMYQVSVAGIRAVKGLPEKDKGLLAIAVPTLKDQAAAMRSRPQSQYFLG